MSKILGKHIPYNRKNFVINGGCRFFQRGNGIALTPNVFSFGGADRIAGGVFGVSLSSAALYRSPMVGAKYGVGQYIASITSTGTGTAQFRHRIEASESKGISGKKVTVSLLAYHNASTALDIQFQLSKPSSEDDWTTVNGLVLSPATSIPPGVPTRVSFTYQIGSNDADLGFEIRPFYAISVALSSTDIGISDLQLEIGSNRSELEDRDFEVEKSQCERFYETSNNTNIAPYANPGADYWLMGFTNAGGSGVVGPIVFRTTKRSSPTMTYWNGPTANSVFLRRAAGDTSTGLSFSIINQNGAAPIPTTSSAAGVSMQVGMCWGAEAEL